MKWRLHTHFEVDRCVPTRIDVTPDGGGTHDERAVKERTIQAVHAYVMNRGYAKFALFNAIVPAGSSYVCRLRDNSHYRRLESPPLTDADRALNVVSDQRIEIDLLGNPVITNTCFNPTRSGTRERRRPQAAGCQGFSSNNSPAHTSPEEKPQRIFYELGVETPTAETWSGLPPRVDRAFRFGKFAHIA